MKLEKNICMQRVKNLNSYRINWAREKDVYKCQICFRESDEITLHAHHILSYNKNVMLANDIDNVIILCKDCHKEIHMREGCKYNQFKRK